MILFPVGTLLILVFLAWATYRTAQLLREIPSTVNLLLLPAENLLRLTLIAVCVGLGQMSRLPYAQLGWISVEPARDIVAGFSVGIAVAMILPPLTHFAVQRFGTRVYSPIVVLSVLPRTRVEWLLVPLALVPSVLLEELLFRSLLLGGFGSFASSLLLAMVWSLIFGAMHLPQGALGIVVASALGLLLSALFLVTRNLLAPFIAHYLINLLQLAWASYDTGPPWHLRTRQGKCAGGARVKLGWRLLMPMQAVILDLDGLLVDSEPLHQRAYNTFLARQGVAYQFDEDEYGRDFVGVPVREHAEWLAARFHLRFTPAEVIAEREAIYQALIENPANLTAMPGTFTLLDKLEMRGMALAVASGSPREQVEAILRGLRIASRFRVTVTGSDVPRTKPAPDVYLRAMQALGIAAPFCVAIEDSATGVAAAKAAGLRVIAVPNRFTRRQDLSRADARAESLEAVISLLFPD
jgi:HAD superfamily hydrolase (TIGR01509 family)